jgi:hypothetical protein
MASEALLTTGGVGALFGDADPSVSPLCLQARMHTHALSRAGALRACASSRHTTRPRAFCAQVLSAEEIGTPAGIAETWRLTLSDSEQSLKVTLARALAPLVRSGGTVAPPCLVAVTGATRRDEGGRRCVPAKGPKKRDLSTRALAHSHTHALLCAAASWQ